MKLPRIKDVMREQAQFVRYQDGSLWYQIIWSGEWVTPEDGESYRQPHLFDFPIPVADAGGGSFGTVEKAVTLMRWITNHIAFLTNSFIAEQRAREGRAACCTNGCKAWDCPNL